MPRVVPSQAVQLIDELFPRARALDTFLVPFADTSRVAAVLAFVKAIPAEVVNLSGQDLSDYAVALAIVERVQQIWAAQRENVSMADYRATNPIVLLRRALSKCPDEAPARGTTELLFIADADADLRESIRRDISAANQDMVNGEWKGPIASRLPVTRR